jgi:hypothetical protein
MEIAVPIIPSTAPAPNKDKYKWIKTSDPLIRGINKMVSTRFSKDP